MNLKMEKVQDKQQDQQKIDLQEFMKVKKNKNYLKFKKNN